MMPVALALTVPTIVALGAPPDGSSPWWASLVPLVLVVAIFWFVILLPARRKQQKVDAFLGALKVGDRVITTGGIYGQITKMGEQIVQIQIAEKIRIDVARASIGGLQGQPAVVESSE